MNKPISFIALLWNLGTLGILGFGFSASADEEGLKKNLAEHFALYVVRDDVRRSDEGVLLTRNKRGGYDAELSYWYSLQARDATEGMCNAYRWLLVGRGTYGQGAQAAFERFTELRSITFRFFDVERGTRVGKKRAEILPTEKVETYLKLGVEKNSLASKKPNADRIKADLDRKRCAQVGKTYIDTRWYNSAYVKESKA